MLILQYVQLSMFMIESLNHDIFVASMGGLCKYYKIFLRMPGEFRGITGNIIHTDENTLQNYYLI